MYFTLSWLIEGLNNGQTIHPEQTKTFGGSLLRNSGDRLMCPIIILCGLFPWKEYVFYKCLS